VLQIIHEHAFDVKAQDEESVSIGAMHRTFGLISCGRSNREEREAIQREKTGIPPENDDY
jgi:hypothetical protein